MIECRAEGEDIRSGIGVGVVSAVLFERGVKCGALSLNDGDGHFAGRHDLYQTKINQFDQSAGRDLDIAGFDIAVDDGRFLVVQVIQRICNLICPSQHFLFIEKGVFAPRILHELTQVFAGDVVHHQIVAGIDRKEIGNFGKVGMIETRENRCLAKELFAGLCKHILWQRPIVFDFFKRAEAPLQTGIFCKVNIARAALPDLFTDNVALTQGLPIHQGWGQTFSFFKADVWLS